MPRDLLNRQEIADKLSEVNVPMTFLIFLASLGALHYILNRSDKSVDSPFRKDVTDARPGEQLGTPGLLTLADAVEEQGRGNMPQSGEARSRSRAKTPS